MADSDFDPVKPELSDWRTPGVRMYGQILRSQLRPGNRYAGQLYREKAFETIGNQTAASEEAIRDAAVNATGFGNTSGRTGEQIAAVRQKAPYNAADLAAREAGRQSAQNTGQAILNKRQMGANYYTTLGNLALQNEQLEGNMALGLAQLDAAASSAGAGGSSGLGALTAGIGAVGNIASVLALAGVI